VTHTNSSMSAMIIHPVATFFQMVFLNDICKYSFKILLLDQETTVHPREVAISTELSVDWLS
jgi:hypothetical protein